MSELAGVVANAALECDVAIIGAGPAGLMTAQQLAGAGLKVCVFEAKPSVARKFLLAGKGGLNLTHSEGPDAFVSRYGERADEVGLWLQHWGAEQMREWAKSLGFDTFVGTSGRVFPADMKAAPLLRAWLARLKSEGVGFFMRHRWQGEFADGVLQFDTEQGQRAVRCRAVVLALGGASWAKLGSDGAWVNWLESKGVDIAPLQPSNCGFDVRVAPVGASIEAQNSGSVGAEAGWSQHFTERFAGLPFKPVALSFDNGKGVSFARPGEFVATATGVEGSLIYAVSAALRNEVAEHGLATFHLDLLPQFDAERVLAEVKRPRGSRSLTSHLKSRLGLEGIKTAVLYEVLGKEAMNDPKRLAQAIKALPITVVAPRPIDEAISTAGGVKLQALDSNGMCQALPGVFYAGEMLDWEAPTGGYLLTACMSSGVRAAKGVQAYLQD